MKQKKTAVRVHTPGTEDPITRWDDPRLKHVHRQPEGSGQFDPCRVFETLERILSQREGVSVKLIEVRATPEAEAREAAYRESVRQPGRTRCEAAGGLLAKPAIPAMEGAG